MPEIKNTFLAGKMNKDVDDRLLPKGEYRDALNIQISKSDGSNVGVVQNIKSNTKLVSHTGYTNLRTIGSYFDDQNNIIYTFNTSNEDDFIYKYDADNDTGAIIVSGTWLNFNTDYLITGVNLIEGYLFWTDGLNPPRRIKISKANNVFYDSEIKVSVVKHSPFSAPSIVISNDPNVDNNYIEDKFVRFSYRYKYEDNEYSQIAPFSQIAFQSASHTFTEAQIEAAYKDGYLKDFTNNINKVIVTVDLPTNPFTDFQITSVEFLMKDANSNAVRIIGRKSLVIDAASIDFEYNSELPVSTLSQDQVLRVSEQAPVIAKAQEVSGNRLIYGNIQKNLPWAGALAFNVEASYSQKRTDGVYANTYHSLKQRRNYEVGIVFSDEYGRKSPVVKTNKLYVQAKDSSFDPSSWYGDSIKLLFNGNSEPLLMDWGKWKYYRIVVKQAEQEYYNVYTPGIFKQNGVSYIQLYGDNVNKVPRDTTNFISGDLSSSNIRLYPKIINSGTFVETIPSYTVSGGNISYTPNVIENIDVSQYLVMGEYISASIQTTTGDQLTSSGTTKYYELSEEPIRSNANVDLLAAPNRVDVYINGKYQYNNYSYTNLVGFGKITWDSSNPNHYSPTSSDVIDIIPIWNYIQIKYNSGQITINALKNLYRSYGSTNYTQTFNAEQSVSLSVNDPYPFSDAFYITSYYQNITDSGLIKINSIGYLSDYTNIDTGQTFLSDNIGLYRQSDSSLLAEMNYIYNVNDLTKHVVDLAVFETEPVKTALDIYYETSTGGTVDSLASLISYNMTHVGGEKLLEVDYYNCFIIKGDTPISGNAWHIEESRIRGDYNADSMDYGVQAHITNEDYTQETRPNALIYSGLFNERTGVNNTNQFPDGEPITRALDIQDGSIQKLFAEETNLTIFQEEKCSWIAINKDIIYTAEGTPQITASNNVLGQVVPYASNYGIGKHPESFAYYAGRKYFVDQSKGTVLRLSRDGITEISNYGMVNYFRTSLSGISETDKIIGGFDIHNKNYVLSIQGSVNDTLSFNENVNGWVSFYSYLPDFTGSLDGKFYSFNEGIYQHYSGTDYNKFYGSSYNNSEIDIVMNDNPSANKNFVTINYEGSKTWNISSIESEQDTGVVDTAYDIVKYDILNEDKIISGFKLYDGKFFANILNNSTAKNEVLYGFEMTGIKGYFAKMKIKIDSADASSYKELFSVAANYNINSY